MRIEFVMATGSKIYHVLREDFREGYSECGMIRTEWPDITIFHGIKKGLRLCKKCEALDEKT